MLDSDEEEELELINCEQSNEEGLLSHKSFRRGGPDDSVVAQRGSLVYVPNMDLSPMQRKKAKGRLHARRRRGVDRQDASTRSAGAKAVSLKRVHMATPVASTSSVPVPSKSSYTGGTSRVEDQREWTLPELMDMGFQLVTNDGHIPIVDGKGRIFVSGCSPPRDDLTARGGMPCWNETRAEALRAILECRDATGLCYAMQHRRGNYATVAAALERLCSNEAVKRVAGYMNDCFRVSQPDLFDLYADTLHTLLSQHPQLQPNFPPEVSVFAAAIFNLGPQMVTIGHYDSKNLGWGMCVVYADGNFNHQMGGHLILWDLKIVLEFPPGTCIILPSALIKHSNVPIQPSESRISFTQYTAAGLFRWVGNGCMSD
ncbi:uncharacterized protein EV420DRAFT_1644949 [Desarmillaria tabescens]|uniref:Prolyl 4-hydroxylase alpha subunit domain-containing protein n=1 Tax=Armillaria tabescens TaxID=1929756 RepID=A0AA39K8C7_ARMTA|nr:uncharacterized protein EV420DRAFT_1644949 [Desarmillaria tabescens]KAK0455310.1 hypothetical protein EV420DRAFT_1644949 [Desarmillaria tabescens]